MVVKINANDYEREVADQVSLCMQCYVITIIIIMRSILKRI
jgi:hypothetical protein